MAATDPARFGGAARASSRERTRARLLAVGRRVFARKGHAGANLKEDILVPARVSVGSFYHQFRDKTDLLLAILEEHSRTFLAMIQEAHRPRAESEPGEIARHSFETVFRIAEQSDDLFRIMVRERESEDPRVRAYLRDNHRRWIESLAADYQRAGVAPPGGNEVLQLAAELITATTLGTVLNYLDRPPREREKQRARLIDGLVRFTIGGLVALTTRDRKGDL
ncbi:MAG: TetR/AcrR family transcriptional regulator [Thermodesulfobacteriota bacterium]